MPVLKSLFTAAGPIINATIVPDASGINALKGLPPNLLQPVPLRLLVDTGASQTLLEEDLFAHWQALRRSPGFFIAGVGGKVPVVEYDLQITLVCSTNSRTTWPIPVKTVLAGSGWKSTNAHNGLLGRDILALADLFRYEGILGQAFIEKT